MPELEQNIGDRRGVFEARHFAKPDNPHALRPKEDAPRPREAMVTESIGRAQSWSELYSAIETAGGLTGSKSYTADDLTRKINLIRQLNQDKPLNPKSPIFDVLTRAGGLREKVKELIGIENIRANIAGKG